MVKEEVKKIFAGTFPKKRLFESRGYTPPLRPMGWRGGLGKGNIHSRHKICITKTSRYAPLFLVKLIKIKMYLLLKKKEKEEEKK